MCPKRMSPLMSLPIELIYRILDHLDPFEIMLSACDVCLQLDQIIKTYPPYQVIIPSIEDRYEIALFFKYIHV